MATDSRSDDPAFRPRGLARLTAPLPLPFSLRGWLTGRRHGDSWQKVVAGCDLPANLKNLTADVALATRLWRREQADVARELCAHFADGREAGVAPERLAEAFGDRRRAATLIRRAKKRQRPLWWQVWRYGLRGVGIALLLLALLYAVLAFRFFTGSPKVSRNFTAELNASILATPPSDQAWPVYLKSLRALVVPNELTLDPQDEKGEPAPQPDGKPADMWPQKPGDPRWPQAVAWVEARSDAIALVREAAAKPALGYPLASTYSPEYAEVVAERVRLLTLTPSAPPSPAPPPDPNPTLTSILLPYLGEFRNMARVLTVDARRAIEVRDGDRFVADVRAMLGIARHCDEPGVYILINELVQAAIVTVACNTVAEALPAGVLTPQHLRDLAHSLAALDDSALHVRFDGERLFLHDMAQRAYTDDGSGGGVITREGLHLLNQWIAMSEVAHREPAEDIARAAVAPFTILAVADRKDLLATGDALFAMAQVESDTPLWERDRPSELEARIERMAASPVLRVRYFPLTSLFPAVAKASRTIELTRQQRDSTLVAIGLELHRARHGEYPSSLDSLVPSVLPAVPPDRYDGRPLKYALVDKAGLKVPLVYSVGVDRTDDGGRRPAETLAGAMHQFETRDRVAALRNDPAWRATHAGDWVLYDPAAAARPLQDSDSGP